MESRDSHAHPVSSRGRGPLQRRSRGAEGKGQDLGSCPAGIHFSVLGQCAGALGLVRAPCEVWGCQILPLCTTGTALTPAASKQPLVGTSVVSYFPQDKVSGGSKPGGDDAGGQLGGRVAVKPTPRSCPRLSQELGAAWLGSPSSVCSQDPGGAPYPEGSLWEAPPQGQGEQLRLWCWPSG